MQCCACPCRWHCDTRLTNATLWQHNHFDAVVGCPVRRKLDAQFVPTCRTVVVPNACTVVMTSAHGVPTVTSKVIAHVTVLSNKHRGAYAFKGFSCNVACTETIPNNKNIAFARCSRRRQLHIVTESLQPRCKRVAAIAWLVTKTYPSA